MLHRSDLTGLFQNLGTEFLKSAIAIPTEFEGSNYIHGILYSINKLKIPHGTFQK